MDKKCIKCGITKNIEMFAKGSKYSGGRRNYCKKCHSDYVVQYTKDNPHKKNKDNPKRKFKRHGLTEDKYNDLFSMYDGKCHSCKDRNAVNIDHDHLCCPGSYSCGKCIRGLLCSQCNTALGLLKDDVVKINNLLAYIS